MADSVLPRTADAGWLAAKSGVLRPFHQVYATPPVTSTSTRMPLLIKAFLTGRGSQPRLSRTRSVGLGLALLRGGVSAAVLACFFINLAFASYLRAFLRNRLAFLEARRAARGTGSVLPAADLSDSVLLWVPFGRTCTGMSTISDPGSAGVAWIIAVCGWLTVFGFFRRGVRCEPGTGCIACRPDLRSSVGITRLYYVCPLSTSTAMLKYQYKYYGLY